MAVPSKLIRWLIGIYIHDYRDAKGISQNGLGRLLGVSGNTLSNWEKAVTMPSAAEVWGIARHLNISDEIAVFMEEIARDGNSLDIELNTEASPRHNALALARAELHYGSIWKWEPTILPGLVQTRAYNSEVIQPAEGITDEQEQFGADFKQQRQDAIEGRADPYRASIIIGDSAIYHLRKMSPESRREQIEYIRECNARPGWEIRVMDSFHNLSGPFSVYVPGKSETAGPPFVYAQIHDRSWCIEELKRVGLYHERVKKNWPRATAVEESLDAKRDLLA